MPLLTAILAGRTEVEIPVVFWPKSDLGSDFRESYFKTFSGDASLQSMYKSLQLRETVMNTVNSLRAWGEIPTQWNNLSLVAEFCTLTDRGWPPAYLSSQPGLSLLSH